MSKGRLGVQEAEVHLGCCFLSIIHLLFVLRQGLTLRSSTWRPKVDIRGLPQLRFMLYFETGYLTWTQNLHFAYSVNPLSPVPYNYSGPPYLPVIQVYSPFHSGSMCFIHGAISLAAHIVFEAGFLTGLELTIKLRWGGQADPRDIVLAASLVLVLQVTMLDIFYVGSGDWTQVLILSWQTLFHWTVYPSPKHCLKSKTPRLGFCCLRVALENTRTFFLFFCSALDCWILDSSVCLKCRN